jgi:hypothetical protein
MMTAARSSSSAARSIETPALVGIPWCRVAALAARASSRRRSTVALLMVSP